MKLPGVHPRPPPENCSITPGDSYKHYEAMAFGEPFTGGGAIFMRSCLLCVEASPSKCRGAQEIDVAAVHGCAGEVAFEGGVFPADGRRALLAMGESVIKRLYSSRRAQ